MNVSRLAGRTIGATRRFCLKRTANRKELAVERAAKKEAVESLNEVFKTTGVAVVAHYSGLTVAQMQTLRTQMKQAGGSVKVGSRDGWAVMINCAARVGSIVLVIEGVSVGGACSIGKVPPNTSTRSRTTQPRSPGAPAYSIWT